MVMGGDGPWAIAVMWIMAALTSIWVGLRLYVRTIIVANTGYDDPVYFIAFVSLFTSSFFRSFLSDSLVSTLVRWNPEN